MAFVQQIPAATPTADVVGNAFVLQYYNILEQSPELVHRFYQDISKLGRPGDDGIMGITTTMEEINKKIIDYGELSANIVTVDAQESFNGGVLVLVTGYLTGNDNLKKKFTQSFFLAPQDVGYFVLNDVFRYVDDSTSQGGDSGLVVDVDVEAHLISDNEVAALKDNHVPEPVNEVTEDFVKEEAYNPTVNGEVSFEEEEAPIPEVINEIPDDLHVVADANAEVEAESYSKVEAESYSKVEAKSYSKVEAVSYSKVEAESYSKVEAESNPKVEVESNPRVEAESNPKVEAEFNPKVEAVSNPKVVTESNSKVEVQKMSYASILKTANANANNLPFSTPAPVRSVPKKLEHQATVAPTPVPVLETAVSSTNARENGNLEPEAEGHSIYIKGLPMNCTNSLIENEFKKFGHIKHNGLQVRLLRGFCFGFVEYDAASAVKAAIEASPIVVGGQRVFVEEKRSTRGNNRSRFSSGRGNGNGYRNEGGSGYRNEGGSGYRNEGGSGYRNEGGSGYRNEGGNGYKTEAGNSYRTEGGNGYRTEGGNGYRTEGGRGRGGYGGGRSYGRGDFNSKSEFGGRSSNRGGSTSRGGDGYQRSDHGGRGNRARSTAPQVSASA